MKLTVGSCFAGIGGLELGLERTGGFETKWQIEFDPYAAAVLAKHWPGVQRFTDIRDVVRPPTVDVICGGFPCQDVSLAGKRAGLEGDRTSLWGEMHRIVCEVRPRWVLAENVPGLLSSDDGQFFGKILRDLASSGYDAEWDCVPAGAVGAHHIRDRLFLLAYPAGIRGTVFPRTLGAESRALWRHEHFQAIGAPGDRAFNRLRLESIRQAAESGISPVVDGVSDRMGDELRCLGNAVVPQVAEKIGKIILTAHARLI